MQPEVPTFNQTSNSASMTNGAAILDVKQYEVHRVSYKAVLPNV